MIEAISSKTESKIPDDAILLIPDPENENDPPLYGVKPGYYNHPQVLDLLDLHKGNSDAVAYIADMLETGNSANDAFSVVLRQSCDDPAGIARIVKICRTDR